MTDHFARPQGPASSPTPRRLVAAGVIRRALGRTFTVRVTAAGATGTIRKAVTR
ncbi:hypothetical protein [Streptomyces flaveolus]|uniref:Uncharacterized protein n=1 Tax=Streptomyces flaveolus TaxID=67297 RepID=A0ABV3A7H3_9ACTN